MPFASVLDVLQRTGGVEQARERAHAFADQAREIMAKFPDSPYQRALAAAADLVIEREF